MEEKKTNVAGILSFIFSIIGLFTVCVGIGYIPGAIAFILGIVGCCKKNCKKGLAVAGIVISIMAIILSGCVSLFGWAWNETEKEKDGIFSKEYGVNDAFEYMGEKITLLAAEDYVSDNEYMQPKEGNKYIKLSFEFENMSENILYVSSFNFEAYADGYAMEQRYIDDENLDASLSKNNKTKGTVFFEVPENAEKITVEYMSNFWSGDKVKFVVK